MIVKDYLTVADQLAFVELVCGCVTIEGEYKPALFEMACRVAAVRFYTDCDIGDGNGGVDIEKANGLVFGTDVMTQLYNAPCSWQLRCLRDACKEQLAIQEKRTSAVLAELARPDPLGRIVEMLEGFTAKMGAFDKGDIAGLVQAADKLAAIKVPGQK